MADWPTNVRGIVRQLAEVKDHLQRCRHLPIPEQGRWLGSVIRGYLAYYAVPGNTDTVAAFRTQATRHWYKALRRRSQRTRLTWTRMNRLATRWLPPARMKHPFPSARFDARTQGRAQCVSSARWDLRGGRPQGRSLPRSAALGARGHRNVLIRPHPHPGGDHRQYHLSAILRTPGWSLPLSNTGHFRWAPLDPYPFSSPSSESR
jgi:hypothetical protein